MERLTKVFDCETPTRVQLRSGRYAMSWNAREDVGKALLRLAAYEDTELEPERVAELAKAEKDGRLVVLPCKVGDTVYFPVVDRFDSAEVDHFEIFKDKVMLAWAQYDRSYESTELWDMDEVDCTEVGTTVFLTSEEAEEAVSQIAQ